MAKSILSKGKTLSRVRVGENFGGFSFSEKELKGLPVLGRILKQLTPKRVHKEIDGVRKTKFPPKLQKWINEYKKVGFRDDFVFRWCYKINKIWFLLNVPPKYHNSLIEVKTLFNIFIVLIDDISERKGQWKLLNELLKIPFYEKYIEKSNLNQKEKEYLHLSIKIWHQIQKTIKNYHRYKEMKDLFYFDVFQFLDAVRYGYFITQDPFRMNEIECWIYFPNSMQLIIDADLDLMCVSRFNPTEIGKFREIILHAQRMGRIGNWLTTWEREIWQNDFTSIVFPHSLFHNIISAKDLQLNNKKRIITKIKSFSVEKYFLKHWEFLFKKIKTMNIKSASINRILSKFRYAIFMHLISRGLK